MRLFAATLETPRRVLVISILILSFYRISGAETNHESFDGCSDSKAVSLLTELSAQSDLRRSFVSTVESDMLENPLIEKGTLWVESNGVLVMQMLTPRLEEYRLTDEFVYIRRPRRQSSTHNQEDIEWRRPKRISTTRLKGMGTLLSAIVNIFSNRVENICSLFHIKFSSSNGTQQGWTLALHQSGKGDDKHISNIKIRGVERAVQSITIDHGKRGKRRFSFLMDEQNEATP